jgi:hypothetical protein
MGEPTQVEHIWGKVPALHQVNQGRKKVKRSSLLRQSVNIQQNIFKNETYGRLCRAYSNRDSSTHIERGWVR